MSLVGPTSSKGRQEQEVDKMNYSESLQYLDKLNVFGVNLGLERVKRLLDLMDLMARVLLLQWLRKF